MTPKFIKINEKSQIRNKSISTWYGILLNDIVEIIEITQTQTKGSKC